MAYGRFFAAAVSCIFFAAGLTSCSTDAEPAGAPADARERATCISEAFLAADGIHVGVNLDWGSETVAGYAERLGRSPADVVSFVPLPWSPKERDWAVQAAEQAAASDAVHLLTLEPQDGLEAVSDDVIDELVDLLTDINDLGVPVVIRFAHEMNGSWYAWGQQPVAYRDAFRRVATAVHERVPAGTMMWAPNYGGGYPFTGGRFTTAPGSADEAALDTNEDGDVTASDDPYAPYYPGDEYVDWVGMSLYHWGSQHPWGENQMPERDKFVQQLTGTYDGYAGDDTGLPDFYAEYGESRNKPVAVPETAALVVDRGDPDLQRSIKQAWWRQLFDPSLHARFPMLRMINWFEWTKYEPEVGDDVDWAVLSDGESRKAYRLDQPEWALYGGGAHC